MERSATAPALPCRRSTLARRQEQNRSFEALAAIALGAGAARW